MTIEQKAIAFKVLMRYPEWKVFADHVKEVAQVHCDSSVNYISKRKNDDASRQADIAEGLVEAIDEPQSLIDEYNHSVKGIVDRACQLCGTVLDRVKSK